MCVRDTRKHREKKEPCDAKLYDFDDVFYRVFIDPEKRDKMLISLEMPNWADVRNQGSESLIKDKLGKYVKDVTNSGVNFEIDMTDASCQNDAGYCLLNLLAFFFFFIFHSRQTFKIKIKIKINSINR